jgi:pyruvate decarboxylase
MVNLAAYLFSRLRQCGVRHVHGMPGDYTLKALDYLGPSGLKWVGSCNELNAGYAADGYARIRGLSAVFTTYGVGELSALNAIAGSFAEHVPVVHIVGTPARHLQNSRALCHHTLGDGELRVFAEVAKRFSVAQANLVDAETAPEMIDRAIQQCLTQSRPAYIELPADMASTDVSADRLDKHLRLILDVDEEVEDTQVVVLLQQIYSAKGPLLLVDSGDGIHHMIGEINEFVRLSGIPTLTMPSGGGMVDHSLESYYGVHSGPVGKIDTMPYVQSSDLVIAFGPMFSDTQTLGWSTVPDPEVTVTIRNGSIHSSNKSHAINGKSFVRKLIDRLDPSKLKRYDASSLGNFRDLTNLPPADPSGPLDQDTLWLRLNSNLRPDDIILLANGTPVIGGRDFVLPPRVKVIASGLWFSVGHMLPAAQGAALAQQENGRGRTILFEGDGSFQATAQELSTIIRLRLNVTIFIINNEGYAYERHINGMNEEYNDVVPWRYLEAAKFFGAPDDSSNDGYKVENHRVSTWGELSALLANESFQNERGLKMVDVVVGKYDVPEKFKEVFRKAREKL